MLDLHDFRRLCVELFDLLDNWWDAFYQKWLQVLDEELSEVGVVQVTEAETYMRVNLGKAALIEQQSFP